MLPLHQKAPQSILLKQVYPLFRQKIFVLLDIGSGEPRHYRLPWDQKLADKLQDILDDPDEGGVMLKIPYEPSLDTNAAQFWSLPQPKALPDKPPQKPAPHFDV